jgi:hypothetical protein
MNQDKLAARIVIRIVVRLIDEDELTADRFRPDGSTSNRDKRSNILSPLWRCNNGNRPAATCIAEVGWIVTPTSPPHLGP